MPACWRRPSLGFAALLAAPQTAHAVDKEIFSRTLTVGATSSAMSTTFGFDGGLNMIGGTLGNFAQRTIPEIKSTDGTPSNRWITELTNDNASGGTLRIHFSGQGTGSTDIFDDAAFRARLTLHLGTDSFDGADATESGITALTWSNSGLTWADTETYAVRLTLDVPGIDSIAFNSAGPDNTFHLGDAVTATVTFDEAVTVTGTPQLTIKVGSADKVLDYSSGSGSAALVFTGYAVASGDTDTDGISIEADKLSLNSGTIKATADENPDAVLTHNAVAASASHKVSGGQAAMVPHALTNFSVTTHATTTPGSIEFSAFRGSGPNITSTEFRASTDSGVNWNYDVTDDWPDTTLDSYDNGLLAGLTPGTAYLFELRGRNADGYGPAVQATGTTAGAVSITGVALTSSPATGTTYDTGEDVVATLTFSRPVTFAEVGGNLPRLELNFGGTAKPAICAAARQQTAVACTYTVVFGDAASGGVAIAANKLTLNGGTIRLGSGGDANVDYTVPLAHTALAADTDHKVDATSIIRPEVSSIALTSSPDISSTYGIGESVEATVTFDASVDISGTPQLELDFDGTGKAADCTAGTLPTTMTCSYDVAVNDTAPSGIAIAANKLTGGTIVAAGTTTAADLDHVAVATDADHKVDGIRPTLVTTGTDAPTTSTDGTKVILTFSESLRNRTASKVTIQAGGVTLPQSGSSLNFGSRTVEFTLQTPLTATATNITVALAADAVFDRVNNGNLALAATTVINAVTAAPAVSSIAFNDAGTDGAFKTGDAVTATVTFSASVTVDTMGGTPQLTIKMGGADKVLSYSSGTGTTALVFSGYTVAANDEDTDGLSIEANKLDANGGTIKETADATVDAVLTHAAVAASTNHKVDGVKPTLVTTVNFAPKTSVDGSKIILVFSENIGSVDTTKITVKEGATTLSLTGQVTSGSRVQLTLLAADVIGSSVTNVTVALAAEAVTDVPGNGIAAVSATSVTRILPPGKPTLTLAAKDQSIEATVVFTAHGTSNITKYQYQIKSGSDAFGSWTDSTKNLSNTGGTFTIGSLTNGTEYTVQVRGVNSDGDGAASDAKTATPDAPPAITSVAITSDPGTDNTYAIDDDIVVTVTFDKTITFGAAGTLNPYVTLEIGLGDDEPACIIGTGNETLVCTETVVVGDEDADGIRIEGDVGVVDKHVLGPLGQVVNYSFSAIEDDSGHKVDGIRPTLSRADADPNDLTKIILTFSEAIGTVTQADITVKKGTTAQTIDSVAIDSTDATKVVVTLDTALLSTDTNVTVDLAADAVKDVPGNGIAEVLGTSVSVEDNVAPTLESAQVIAGSPRSVVLIFDEALASGSTPATSRFTVKVEGNSRTPSSVSRPVGMPKRISLTLGPTQGMRPGDTVTVSYTKPGLGRQPAEGRGGQRGRIRSPKQAVIQQPRRHRPGRAGEPRRGSQ